jgi:hypothetical protein
MTFWFVNTFDKFQRKTFPQFKVNELATFPIFSALESEQQSIIRLVLSIQDSHQHLAETTEGTSRFVEISKHLQELDSALDALVYSIVGLTSEEILIVESNL